MTTVSPPPVEEPTPQEQRASSRPSGGPIDGRTIALGVAGALGIALLALLATQTVAAIVVFAVVVVIAVTWAFLRYEDVMPFAMGISLWFEGLAVGPISVGRVVAAAIVAMVLIRILFSSWRPPALRPIGWVPPLLFLGYAVLSGLWSAQFGGWLLGFVRLFVSVAYGLGFMWFISSSMQLRRVLVVWYWTCVPLAALSGIFYLLSDLRTAGASGGPNSFGAYLAAALLVGFSLGFEAEGRVRNYYFASFAAPVFGLIASGSRGGMMAFAAAVGYILVFFPIGDWRRRVRFLVVGSLVAGVVGFVVITLNPRFLELSTNATSGRLDIWAVAFAEIRRAPLFGKGLGQFAATVLETFQVTPNVDLRQATGQFAEGGEIDPHSTYIGLMVSYGIFGPLLYGGMIGAAYLSLRRVRDPQWRLLNWSMIGILFSLLVAGLFGSAEKHKILWVVIGISAAMQPIRQQTPSPVVSADAEARQARRREVRRLSRRPLALDPFLGRVEQRLGSPWPLRRVVAVAALAAVFLGIGVTASQPVYATGTVDLVSLKWDSPNPASGVTFVERRAQSLLALGRSPAFFHELRRRAGLDLSLPEMEETVDARRPDFGAIVRVKVRHVDAEVTRRLAEQVVPAMNHLVDQMRAGATIGASSGVAELGPDDEQAFTGLLYLDLYGGRPAYGGSGPSLLGNIIVSLTLVLPLTFAALAIANSRLRVDRRQHPERLLRVRQLGSVPLIRRRRLRRETRESLKGLAVSLDSRLPGGLGVVAVTADTATRNRARLAAGLGMGLASALDVPTVIVDLDLEHRRLSRSLRLSRRAGVAEWLNGDAAPEALPVPMDRRRVPSFMRGFTTGDHSPALWAVAAGRAPVDHVSAPQLGGLIEALSETHAVVVNLPRSEGPIPVGPLVGVADLVVLLLVDGWTEVDDALMTIDVLRSSATGRLGYLLVDNALAK